MKCKDCKYWDGNELSEGTHGNCSCEKFTDANRTEKVADGLYYWDYESYECGFSTGPYFGCIHFKEKE